MSRQPNSDDGSHHNSKGASTRHQEHHVRNQITPWLFGHTLRRNSTISRVGYDIEHPLQCIFIQGKCTQPSMQTLLHGMETQSHTANQIEWSIFQLVCNITVCHCISCGSRTWCIIFKLQTNPMFWLTLEEMGYPQPPTPVNCDYCTAVGITNNTVKHQHSRSMVMSFFLDCRCSGSRKVWHQILSREKNLGDYQSKHHLGAHHIAVCPWYLHEKKNYQEPASLALWKGVLESCQMGSNGQTHYHKFPLSRVSQQVGNAYLVTLDSQYRFLRYIAS